MSGLHEQGPVDWHRVQRERQPAVAAVDSKARLRACVVAFLVLLAVVFGRVVQLELTQGAAFRRAAAELVVRTYRVPAARGRIVSRDGTVLAQDREVACVAVRYRYLEDPPDAAWLRARARARLTREARRDPARMAAAEALVREERQQMHQRLATLCGATADGWNRRAAEIQARVERIAESVNRRQREAYQRRQREDSQDTLADRWLGPAEEKEPDPIVVREAMDYRGEADWHVMAGDVPAAVVTEIEGRPERWPGVQIVRQSRREYPARSLAAHVVGYLGRADDKNGRRGVVGIERQYDEGLRGHEGVRVERADRSGRVVASEWETQPRLGENVELTLDARLQATAETLLDEALARRELTGAKPEHAGAAAVVMDVHSGAILAAASAPRFDPNVLGGSDAAKAAAVLADPGQPLFDRVVQMAVAPGSLFKVVSAVALVESGVDPGEAFYCRGYLERPSQWRCQIYREHERGHGEVMLADALAVSCNVYFFDRAGRMGPGPLADWAARLGLGRRTGVDLPGEAAGCVPTPETIHALEGHAWGIGDTRRTAIGQGSVTVTPVQAVRMMAAVANGGRLVVPHVMKESAPGGSAAGGGLRNGGDSCGLDPPYKALAAVRQGLRAAVASPEGTAHATVADESVEIAGKTGTAETGGGRADHAWFAGYAPAEQPRLAVVVVVTHAGEGGEAAGPVARRLGVRAKQLGLLDDQVARP